MVVPDPPVSDVPAGAPSESKPAASFEDRGAFPWPAVEEEPSLPPPFMEANIDSLLLNDSAPSLVEHSPSLPEANKAFSPFAVIPEAPAAGASPDPKDPMEEPASIEDFPPFRLVPPCDGKPSFEALRECAQESPPLLEEAPVLKEPQPALISDMLEEPVHTETMQTEFATVTDAMQAITPHGPESVSDDEGLGRGPKRARASSAVLPKLDAEETEPEHTVSKVTGKRRRTLPEQDEEDEDLSTLESTFNVPAVSTALVEMGLSDLPEGWYRPLVHFVTEQQHESWGRAWKQLPDRRVSTGAVYVAPDLTGTPGVANHAEGPTAVLRDLCALVQSPNDEPSLHERSYVSLSRASVRETISLASRAPGTLPSFELGVTKLVKAQAEKEYLQPVPLDVVCDALVHQIRALQTEGQKFPTHLFALDVHVWQYAPTVGLLVTRMGGLRQGLVPLLEAFASTKGRRALRDLTKVHQVRIASVRSGAGSRRRGERAAGTTLTYRMPEAEQQLVEELCTDVESQLRKVRINWVPKPATDIKPTRAFTAGETIVQGLSVLCVPRSTAALRHRVLKHLGIGQTLQLPFNDVMLDNESEETFKTMVSNLLKEENRWLNNFQHAMYLDLTLSMDQERWLMSNERLFQNVACPPTDADLSLVQAAVHNIADEHNASIIVNVSETKNVHDVCTSHRVLISLIATRDISPNDSVKLDSGFSPISWTDLITDEPVPDSATQD